MVKTLTNIIKYCKIIIATFGGFLSWILGDINGLVYMLICFVIFDYISGVCSAIFTKTLSSVKGFNGILKKVCIFMLVGIANLVDRYVLKTNSVLRDCIISYYIANEGISILENCAIIGLPIPEKIRDVLIQLKNKGGDKDGNQDD